MKKVRSFALAIASFVTVSTVSTASADSFDDVQLWVGSGTNQAAMVVDWNDGKVDKPFTWGYRWDGAATGLDMFQAIVSADSRLFAHVGPDSEFGPPIYGIGFDLNNDSLFGTSPSLTFDSGGWSVGSPNDARGPADVADQWAEGWFEGFWGYYIRPSANDAWDAAFFGPLDRTLSDGVWDGYSFAPGFDFTAPSEVPEPGVLELGFVGGLVLLGRRMRNRNAGISAASSR